MGTEVWQGTGLDMSGFDIYEWHHGSAVLASDRPNEFRDIVEILSEFRLKRSQIIQPGKNKSDISRGIDQEFYRRGWIEHSFDTNIRVDGVEMPVPTHKVDCYRNNVAFEIEWNNKDPFFDRDLSNFRLLFDLRVVSVGVILTRSSGLQKIFNMLGKGDSYGNSTTHIDKLMPRIRGGGGGGCPIVVFGISDRLYVED